MPEDPVDPMAPEETVFTEDELEAIGPVNGRRVLVHVGGGVGSEALQLAEAGAAVTALVPYNLGDPEEAETLRAAAHEAGFEIEVVDLHDEPYPEAHRQANFDLVYVGPMSVCWVADHDGWSHDLFEAVAPGGKLVIYDEHPDSYNLLPLSEEDQEEVEKIEERIEEQNPDDVTGPLPDRFDWDVDEFLGVLEQAGFDPIEAVDLLGPARFLTAVDIVSGDSADIPGAILIVARKPASP